MSKRPELDLTRVKSAQVRFDAAMAQLDDGEILSPSLLPGWTIGHVLTHVARNADSHRQRAQAAARGVVVDQYEGGYAGRAAAIDQGALRRADEIIADVKTSALALEETWRTVPDSAWVNVTRDVGGRERPLHALPARRWQELEVHLVDLGTGPTFADWTDDFVLDRLPALRAGLSARLPEGAVAPAEGVLEPREELAWLTGRLSRPGLPLLSAWS
ncbi:MAG: maleylpyruvate isomerase N-terminal domain-containing protein [Acidimicrobiales bacterium]